MLRGKYFNQISKIANWGLILSGVFLFIFQLKNYYTDHSHGHNTPDVHEHHH